MWKSRNCTSRDEKHTRKWYHSDGDCLHCQTEWECWKRDDYIFEEAKRLKVGLRKKYSFNEISTTSATWPNRRRILTQNPHRARVEALSTRIEALKRRARSYPTDRITPYKRPTTTVESLKMYLGQSRTEKRIKLTWAPKELAWSEHTLPPWGMYQNQRATETLLWVLV